MFLFWNILWIFAGYSAITKLSTVLVIQAAYVAHLCIVRPLKMLSDNLAEIFLESSYLGL